MFEIIKNYKNFIIFYFYLLYWGIITNNYVYTTIIAISGITYLYTNKNLIDLISVKRQKIYSITLFLVLSVYFMLTLKGVLIFYNIIDTIILFLYIYNIKNINSNNLFNNKNIFSHKISENNSLLIVFTFTSLLIQVNNIYTLGIIIVFFSFIGFSFLKKKKMFIFIPLLTSLFFINIFSYDYFKKQYKYYFSDMLQQFFKKDYNYLVETKIGYSGSINNSKNLIFRLYGDNPGYLSTGSYNYLVNNMWGVVAKNSDENIYKTLTNTYLFSNDNLKYHSQFKIVYKNKNNRINIPMSNNTFKLISNFSQQNIMKDRKNQYYVKNIDNAYYNISYFNNINYQNEALPNNFDYSLSFLKNNNYDNNFNNINIYKNIEKLYYQLGLDNGTEQEKVDKIFNYFSNYKYTLNLEKPDGTPRSINDFLTIDKRGHCEYFATATTLLLRRAGIPSRYQVGFLVNDFNEKEQSYWVRESNAHAWSIAYYNNKWNIIDTTATNDIDNKNKIIFIQNIIDYYYYIDFQLEQIDYEKLSDEILKYNIHYYFSTIIIGLLIYFLIKNKKQKNSKEILNYKDLKSLEKIIGPKYSYETLLQWIDRNEHHLTKEQYIQYRNIINDIYNIIY